MTMENWEQDETLVRKPKKKLNWRSLFVSVLILAMSFGTGFAGVQLFADDTDEEDGFAVIDSGSRVKAPDEPIHVLLLGTDARPGEKIARTDTVILASIDVKNKKAGLLSIPRDTLVNIPGRGKDKINAATVYGGPELAKETVEDIVGIDIDYYALTNFNGFQSIIDVLGGVTIDVERNMRYRDNFDGTNINLKKGVQRLAGKEALDYSRFRSDALGDIGRTARQQKMLKAIADEMLQVKTITKLPRLIPEMNKMLDTNVPLKDMIKLATLAKDLDNLQIVSQTLPGQFYNNRGSYWRYDAVLAKKVVPSLLAGETFPMITGADINETPKRVVAKSQEPTNPVQPAPQPVQPEKSNPSAEQPVEDIVVPNPVEPVPVQPQPNQPGTTQPQPGQSTSPQPTQPQPGQPTQPQPNQPQPGQPPTTQEPVEQNPASQTPEVNQGSGSEPLAPGPATTTSGPAQPEKRPTGGGTAPTPAQAQPTVTSPAS